MFSIFRGRREIATPKSTKHVAVSLLQPSVSQLQHGGADLSFNVGQDCQEYISLALGVQDTQRLCALADRLLASQTFEGCRHWI